MTHPSKRKGSAFELFLVKFLQSLGIAAEKVPLSGAVKSEKFDHDVTAPVMGLDRKFECKISKDGYRTQYQQLGGNYALVFRANRQDALVTMRLEDFGKLVVRANNDYAQETARLANIAHAAGMVS